MRGKLNLWLARDVLPGSVTADSVGLNSCEVTLYASFPTAQH